MDAAAEIQKLLVGSKRKAGTPSESKIGYTVEDVGGEKILRELTQDELLDIVCRVHNVRRDKASTMTGGCYINPDQSTCRNESCKAFCYLGYDPQSRAFYCYCQ